MSEEAILSESSAALLALARREAGDSADIYEDLAAAFEVANNPATEAAFRDLAQSGRHHAAALPAPAETPARLPRWEEHYPELSDPDQVHYRMAPWHAYDLALRHEGKILTALQTVAERATTPDLRQAAEMLARLQHDRVTAIQARRDAAPMPEPGWWDDHDGPNWQAES